MLLAQLLKTAEAIARPDWLQFRIFAMIACTGATPTCSFRFPIIESKYGFPCLATTEISQC